MIKGCEKKLILVPCGEASPFETAYFILRKDSERLCGGGDNIIKEADRIIAEHSYSRKKKRRFFSLRKGLTVFFCFSAGFIFGCAAAIIAMLSR